MEEIQQFVGVAPSWHAIIPLVGIACLLGCALLVLRRRKVDSLLAGVQEALWSVPALLVLVLLALMCSLGLYVSSEGYLIAATALAALSGCATLLGTSSQRPLGACPCGWRCSWACSRCAHTVRKRLSILRAGRASLESHFPLRRGASHSGEPRPYLRAVPRGLSDWRAEGSPAGGAAGCVLRPRHRPVLPVRVQVFRHSPE